MKVSLMGFVGLFIVSSLVSAQSLLEKAEAESKEKELSYELNGYLRSVVRRKNPI